MDRSARKTLYNLSMRRSGFKRKPRKSTKAEKAYIRDLKRVSTFAKLDRGEAQILSPKNYPAPVKRFLAREQDKSR
jgi:hypothetical protein